MSHCHSKVNQLATIAVYKRIVYKHARSPQSIYIFSDAVCVWLAWKHTAVVRWCGTSQSYCVWCMCIINILSKRYVYSGARWKWVMFRTVFTVVGKSCATKVRTRFLQKSPVKFIK